jgi:hypothetical protein
VEVQNKPPEGYLPSIELLQGYENISPGLGKQVLDLIGDISKTQLESYRII